MLMYAEKSWTMDPRPARELGGGRDRAGVAPFGVGGGEEGIEGEDAPGFAVHQNDAPPPGVARPQVACAAEAEAAAEAAAPYA